MHNFTAVRLVRAYREARGRAWAVRPYVLAVHLRRLEERVHVVPVSGAGG